MSFPGASFSSLVRHDVYYINGGDLYFLVQTVTFRVHRYFFERESPRFKGLLSAPASPGAQRQGTSDSNAIVLDNVSPEEFAKFLWVFYNPRYSLYHTTPEDWSIILDLAWRWQFGEVKALCVRELERLVMLDVDRISVYHKFDVDRNLLIPRYAALCAREDPISLEEGMKLGLETALMIARIRELSRASPAKDGARSPSASPIQGPEMQTLVRQMFDIKGSTESYESGYSPIGENSNSSSTSFTAAAQAIGAQASPARPAKKTSNDVVNNALNGNAIHDINSPPRPATPAAAATTRALSPPPVAPAPVATAPVAPAPTVPPTVPTINTDLSSLDPLTSSGANATNNAKAEATNANAAKTTATANGDASTPAPTDGQTSTTEGENKPNAAETPKQEEASAISKTSAANEDEPSNRSGSPTSIARGIWNKRGGKAKK
jgi:hypothetical protein